MAKHIKFPGQYCFIDEFGKVIIPGTFVFNEGLAAVLDKNNNKWGFIDRKGREVIECIYDEVYQFFEENHCEVKLNGKRITIDNYGN